MSAVEVEIASLVEGDFVSLQQHCRGQVHRIVPPTEMQIIVANKKDRNVDLPAYFLALNFINMTGPYHL